MICSTKFLEHFHIIRRQGNGRYPSKCLKFCGFSESVSLNSIFSVVKDMYIYAQHITEITDRQTEIVLTLALGVV